jgi:hypothetical protein
VNSFPVGEKNHAKKTILHLRDLYPTANATVSLDDFPARRPNGLFDPFVTNHGKIGPAADRGEVAIFTGSTCGISALLPHGAA